MKLNSKYVVKNVLDSDILIDIGSIVNSVIKLNKTSKDVVELVIKGLNREAIVDSLYEKYNVDMKTLNNDINSFIDEMLNKGIFIDG